VAGATGRGAERPGAGPSGAGNGAKARVGDRATQRRPGPAGRAVGEPDPESVARLICLRMLTAAPRTRAQLADALRRRGVPEDATAAVLARFAEVGLIDDAMFASAWVESRHHGRGLGRRALTAELGRRGVDQGDIQAAVARLSPETERATARALVERRLADTVGQPAQARVRRLVALLARKGYPAGLTYQVVREALDREAAELGQPSCGDLLLGDGAPDDGDGTSDDGGGTPDDVERLG